MFEWVHYQFPSRIFFERESTERIGTLVRDVGQRIMLFTVNNEVTNPEELSMIKASLERNTSGCIIYDEIDERPTYDELDTAASFLRQSKTDLIVAVGARETFHAAKAIALLWQNELFAADLQAASFPLRHAPIPIVNVPMSPAMGEECNPSLSLFHTPNGSECHGSDWRLFPSILFVDPLITSTLTESEMARSGVAVMAGCIEAVLAKRANEITNSIALRALELVARNLVQLINQPSNVVARMNLSMASVLCGMAHSNTQLGLCYAIAFAVSMRTQIDFNSVVVILLPHVMEYNLTAAAGKYVPVARALRTDLKDITVIEAAITAVEAVRMIYDELQLPQRLSDFDLDKKMIPALADAAANISWSSNTPRAVDRNEIETILIAAY